MFGFLKKLAEYNQAKADLARLMDSIWRAEFRDAVPEWKPLDDLPGMISQADNMYAGVRNERDGLRSQVAGLRIQNDTHVELGRATERRLKRAIDERDTETLRANGLAAEARALLIQNETHVALGHSAERKLKLAVDEREALKSKCDGLLRDKLNESERAKLAESRVNALLDQIEALAPDAEKHRERLRRDRDNAAAKRASKIGLAA